MRRSCAVAFLYAIVGACSQPPCHEDYQSCEAASECSTGASCTELDWAFGSDAICSIGCENELDCPRAGGRSGRCIDVNRTGDFRCYAECSTDAHCPDGWVCQPIRSAGVVSGICLP